MMALARREFHLFQAAGKDFLYLVPSAAVFALDAPTSAVLRVVSQSTVSDERVVEALAGRFDAQSVRAAIAELLEVRAIGYEQQPPEQPVRMLPMMPFPLTTMVLNVTNQCNLACTYCYEYGEDKIVDTAHGKKPKFMAEQTARDSVDFLLRESGDVAHRAQLVRVRSGEAMTQRDIAVGRDAEQAEPGAARVGLAHALVNLFERFGDVREAVMPVRDRVLEPFLREEPELREHAVEAAVADRV